MERGEPVPCLRLVVPGMTCRHCLRTVTASLRDVVGVISVEADVRNRTVVLRGGVDAQAALDALRACGFPGRLASVDLG